MMLYVELERAEGWKPGVPGLGLGFKTRTPFHRTMGVSLVLLGLGGNPKPWPEEMGEWAVCS